MVSESKLKANSENSKRGGVKTAEGKAISKNNSLKHGILAQGQVRGDPVTFEEVYEKFCLEFKPETPSREILVQQLTLTVLRLSRCSRLESEIYKEQEAWDWENCTLIGRLTVLSERYESRLVGRMLRLIESLGEK